MDKLSAEQRHRNMAAIHATDTKPEMIVRKYLFSHGFRYRLNHRRLPGRPDIVLRKYRTCIFVNGCFWHGHEGCRYFKMPKSNTEFWTAKVERNRERDKRVQRELAVMGWHCITVWECELKPKVRERTLESLEYTLNRIFLEDRMTLRTEAMPEENAEKQTKNNVGSTSGENRTKCIYMIGEEEDSYMAAEPLIQYNTSNDKNSE